MGGDLVLSLFPSWGPVSTTVAFKQSQLHSTPCCGTSPTPLGADAEAPPRKRPGQAQRHATLAKHRCDLVVENAHDRAEDTQEVGTGSSNREKEACTVEADGEEETTAETASSRASCCLGRCVIDFQRSETPTR